MTMADSSNADPAGDAPGPSPTMTGGVRIGRIYDPGAPEDGRRVLVDRIWPRGLSKEKAGLDEWCREVSPSTALRKWYAHDHSRFDEFARRYRAELEEPDRAGARHHLEEVARHGPLTLLTATKDPNFSHAMVLAALLTPDG
jgi:uncharacterized protein YeaO (DUF488 family)